MPAPDSQSRSNFLEGFQRAALTIAIASPEAVDDPEAFAKAVTKAAGVELERQDNKRTKAAELEAAETARQAAAEARSLRMHAMARELRKTMQCNCNLDRYEPENSTGHSFVCRIHKAVWAAEHKRQDGLKHGGQE